MKINKFILPLIGAASVATFSLPMVVSCAQKEQPLIVCDWPKTQTITSSSQEVRFNCKFTGNKTPFLTLDEEDFLIAAIIPYEETEIGYDAISTHISINTSADSQSSSFYGTLPIDANGNFSFSLHVIESNETKKVINFKLRFIIFNGDGVSQQIEDGFAYTIGE